MRTGSQRAVALIGALGASWLLLAACSSSGAPGTSVDAGADRSAATAINLRASDLPGWQQTPASASDASDPTSRRLAACAGAPDLSRTHVVDVTSPNFDKDASEVSSDVTTVRTHADGRAELAAITGPKIEGCIDKVLVPQLEAQLPPGASVSNLHVTHLPAPGGAPSAFLLRMQLTITVPEQGSVTLVGDLDGVLVGRAELELTVFQSDGATPDQALEQHLLTTLVQRAHSAGF